MAYEADSYMNGEFFTKEQKTAAKRAVVYAYSTGRLKHLPCEICGEPKTQGHHESYAEDRQLDVIFLCPKHHRERHMLLDADISGGVTPKMTGDFMLDYHGQESIDRFNDEVYDNPPPEYI